MHTFGFTEKKFKALPRERQEKWIINWLCSIYNDLLEDKINEKSLMFFYKEYLKVQSWTGTVSLPKPLTNEKRVWIEFISDCINLHRQEIQLIPKEYDFLPKVTTKDVITKKPWEPKFPYTIALDGLRSVFNTGSIFRICDAVGFKSIILGNTLGKEHHGVQKTSMGSANWIPQTKTDNLAETLLKYRNDGQAIIGIETIKESLSYVNFPWPDNGIIVFGNEEYGISTKVMQVCTDFVHIPMFGQKNSINVANAVSVIAFQIASF